MAIEIITRPLESWPREFTAERRRAPFRTKFEPIRRKLISELQQLGAKLAIVQVAVRERDISRLTGFPLADVKPTHPGVIVAADGTRHGALKWLCDDCVAWTDNLYAIALTLERLRLADRYGVTRRGEQYAGWKMLPGPITGSEAPSMSIEQAARFVYFHGGDKTVSPGLIIRDKDVWQNVKRAAAKRLHPDAGGPAEEWKKFQHACVLLDNLHNRK